MCIIIYVTENDLKNYIKRFKLKNAILITINYKNHIKLFG